jgi:hypothetical protein
VIFRAIRKRVDTVLGQLNPFTRLELGTNFIQHFFLGYDFHCHCLFLIGYASVEAIKCSRAATFRRLRQHSQENARNVAPNTSGKAEKVKENRLKKGFEHTVCI